MSVIDTVKEFAGVIQKLDNMDLLKRMVELQEQVYEVVNENLELKATNRELTETLKTRAQMTARKNSYWRGEDGPFCMRCFDEAQLTMRMVVATGRPPRCPKCQMVAVDPDEKPPSQRGVLASRRSSFLELIIARRITSTRADSGATPLTLSLRPHEDQPF